jgi:uncharacterized membrane protein YcaP (DUF421 family)
MDPIIPLDFQRMFLGEQPPLYLVEILLRVFLIYGFSVLALRYMGKRGRRQLTPFEFIVIIALGSATGDSMFYPEVPVLYAWLVIASMVALDNIVASLQARYKRVNNFMEGVPRLLIRDGEVLEDELAREQIRVEELFSQLRENEVLNTGEIRYAFLEPSGNLGIVRFQPSDRKPGADTLPDSPYLQERSRTIGWR